MSGRQQEFSLIIINSIFPDTRLKLFGVDGNYQPENTRNKQKSVYGNHGSRRYYGLGA